MTEVAEVTEIDRGGAAVADDIGAATLAVVTEVQSTEVVLLSLMTVQLRR